MTDLIRNIFSPIGVILITIICFIILFITSGTPNPHDLLAVGLEDYKIKLHAVILPFLFIY